MPTLNPHNTKIHKSKPPHPTPYNQQTKNTKKTRTKNIPLRRATKRDAEDKREEERDGDKEWWEKPERGGGSWGARARVEKWQGEGPLVSHHPPHRRLISGTLPLVVNWYSLIPPGVYTIELSKNSKLTPIRFPPLVDWKSIRLPSSISSYLSTSIHSFVKNRQLSPIIGSHLDFQLWSKAMVLQGLKPPFSIKVEKEWL